jgi:hypothetical protein
MVPMCQNNAYSFFSLEGAYSLFSFKSGWFQDLVVYCLLFSGYITHFQLHNTHWKKKSIRK